MSFAFQLLFYQIIISPLRPTHHFTQQRLQHLPDQHGVAIVRPQPLQVLCQKQGSRSIRPRHEAAGLALVANAVYLLFGFGNPFEPLVFFDANSSLTFQFFDLFFDFFQPLRQIQLLQVAIHAVHQPGRVQFYVFVIRSEQSVCDFDRPAVVVGR